MKTKEEVADDLNKVMSILDLSHIAEKALNSYVYLIYVDSYREGAKAYKEEGNIILEEILI